MTTRKRMPPGTEEVILLPCREMVLILPGPGRCCRPGRSPPGTEAFSSRDRRDDPPGTEEAYYFWSASPTRDHAPRRTISISRPRFTASLIPPRGNSRNISTYSRSMWTNIPTRSFLATPSILLDAIAFSLVKQTSSGGFTIRNIGAKIYPPCTYTANVWIFGYFRRYQMMGVFDGPICITTHRLNGLLHPCREVVLLVPGDCRDPPPRTREAAPPGTDEVILLPCREVVPGGSCVGERPGKHGNHSPNRSSRYQTEASFPVHRSLVLLFSAEGSPSPDPGLQ